MRVTGVDGCRGGWCAVILSPGKCAVDVFPDFSSVYEKFGGGGHILVDIPVGLPEKGPGPRECDRQARRLLGMRASSVFTVGARKALYSKDYRTACRVNASLTGKKISIQSWNITPKIREVDRLLRSDKKARKVVREIHPEICFWALNGQKAMAHNKKTPEGTEERLSVLRAFVPDIDFLVRFSLPAIRGAGSDDIIDAFAAAVTARMCTATGRWYTLPEKPQFDTCGLPMEMAYYTESGVQGVNGSGAGNRTLSP